MPHWIDRETISFSVKRITLENRRNYFKAILLRLKLSREQLMFGLPKKTSALLARSKPIFYSCTLIVASRFHNETTCTYVILNMNIVLLLFVAELNFKLVMARTGVNLSKGLLTQAKLSFSITCRLNIHHSMMPKICSFSNFAFYYEAGHLLLKYR